MKVLFSCLVVLLLFISFANGGEDKRKREHEDDLLNEGNLLPKCTNNKQFIIADEIFEDGVVFIKGVREYIERTDASEGSPTKKLKTSTPPGRDNVASSRSQSKSVPSSSTSPKEQQKAEVSLTPYAVKVSNQESTDVEVKFLTAIGNKKGFPKLIGHGSMPVPIKEQDYGFYVMTRLGPDLYSIQKMLNSNFSIDTILGIGAEVVECFRSMHEEGFIHEDIKVENLCIGGTENTKNTLYMIDFEYVERIMKTKDEKLFTSEKSFGFGTATFMSRAAIRYDFLCASDDFESLAYVLVKLASDNLPKMLDISSHKDTRIGAEAKDNFWNDSKEMEQTLGQKGNKLLSFMQAVKALKRGHPIDYDNIKDCLTRKRVKFEWDWKHLSYSEIIARINQSKQNT